MAIDNDIVLDLLDGGELAYDLRPDVKPVALAVRKVQPVEQPEKQGVVNADDHERMMAQMEAMKLVGRMEMAQFYATITDKAVIETYITLKQGKKYKGLPYVNEKGENAITQNLEDFCKAFFGKSNRRVQEIVANYKTIGADLYDQAEKIGFRQQDYNALKKVPEADRQTVAEAIKGNNLDQALELIDQLAIKHVQEKEALADAADMAQKELMVEIKQLNAKLERSEDYFNNLTREHNKVQNDFDNLLVRQPEHNPYALDQATLAAREESAAYAFGVELHCGHMQLLLNKHFKTGAASDDDVRVRITAYARAISAMVMAVAELEEDFKRLFVESAALVDVSLLDKFTDDELERMVTTRAMLTNQFNDKKQKRAYERQLNDFTKRGRPWKDTK